MRRPSSPRYQIHKPNLRSGVEWGAASSRRWANQAEAVRRASCRLCGSGAWRLPRYIYESFISGGKTGGGHLARLDLKISFEDLERVLEQASLWWARRARAVLVVSSAMARAHKEPRLRKPSHGTAQVRAIDREYLEAIAIDVTHPARDVR